MDILARLRGEKLGRLVLSHAVVAASFVTWRVIESSPATSAVRGSEFVTTPLGRGAALVLVLASALCSVGILIQTIRLRRQVVAWVLFATWVGALAQRSQVDALDVTYVLVVALAAAGAFAIRRT